MSFLETFLKNLLMGEHNELKNRYMHIRWEETTHSTSKQHIEQHIEQHIGQHIPKQNSILNLLDTKEISSKMKSNIIKLYEAFGMEKIFGRSDVIEVLGITERPASTLLGKMYSLGSTEKITGTELIGGNPVLSDAASCGGFDDGQGVKNRLQASRRY